MADKLTFTLVSPERELFSGPVDEVVAPGSEGEFGVLAHHAPFMATLAAGALRVIDGGDERRIFVRGGFADVTPQGLTVLAEEAVDLADVDPAALAKDLQDAREDLADAEDDAKKAAAQAHLDKLEAMQAAMG